jgi:hypothetical protein
MKLQIQEFAGQGFALFYIEDREIDEVLATSHITECVH